MGCIGMGQAPATGRNSLRTMPRNFPGRSGTKEDSVWLCSPETAAASALTGVITDPRDWARDAKMDYPKLDLPQQCSVNTAMLVPPLDPEEVQHVEPVKGPNVSSLPELSPLPNDIEAPVLLKVGDNISTDEISPAGARALPFRSNIPKLAMFSFTQIDDSYPERAQQAEKTGHIIVGGENYGQGSSREHAAIAPRPPRFAGRHRQVIRPHPLAESGQTSGCWRSSSTTPDDYDKIEQDDTLRISGVRDTLADDDTLQVDNVTKDTSFTVRHRLSPRQVKDVLAGGLIPRLADDEK